MSDVSLSGKSEERRAEKGAGAQELAAGRNETLIGCRDAFERAFRANGFMYSLQWNGHNYVDRATQDYWTIWQCSWLARALPSEIRLTKAEWADAILAGFQNENNRTKVDEWEAAYAMLFKQLNEATSQKRESGEAITHRRPYLRGDESIPGATIRCRNGDKTWHPLAQLKAYNDIAERFLVEKIDSGEAFDELMQVYGGNFGSRNEIEDGASNG